MTLILAIRKSRSQIRCPELPIYFPASFNELAMLGTWSYRLLDLSGDLVWVFVFLARKSGTKKLCSGNPLSKTEWKNRVVKHGGETGIRYHHISFPRAHKAWTLNAFSYEMPSAGMKKALAREADFQAGHDDVWCNRLLIWITLGTFLVFEFALIHMLSRGINVFH